MAEDRETMSSAVVEVESETSVEETEAYQVLISRVGRRTGKIPADLMVRHVLGCVPPHEWPTRIEAMDAVIRRIEAARKDSLRIESRPADRRVLGHYLTRRPGAGARGRITRSCTGSIRSRGAAIVLTISRIHWGSASTFLSCSNSCLVVRALQQAFKEQEWESPQWSSGLNWDPVRPLTGLGDWLDRVVWRGDVPQSKARSVRVSEALKWFRASKDGVASLKSSLF